MKKFLVLLCSIVMIFGIVSASLADPLMWSFTNTPITVSPTETIDMNAVITNISATDFSGRLVGVGLDNSGSSFGVYDMSFNSDLYTIWDPLVLAPGESESFTFATLAPIGGSAPVGTYYTGSNHSFNFVSDSAFVRNTQRFEITVISDVPEPSTMLLIGTGLVGLLAFRRKFKS